MFSQVNRDSIRKEQKALQMIGFPEPEFSKHFAANRSPKAIAEMGIE